MTKIDENEIEQEDFEKYIKLIDNFNSIELNDKVLNQKIKNNTDDEREEELNNVLKSFNTDFERRSSTNKTLKKIFLIWTMILFSIIVGGCIAVLILSVIKNSIFSIAPSLSSVGILITSFIVLPKIIARYLFPEGETKDTIDLVKTIATHGVEMKLLNKDKKENKAKKED